MEKAPLGRLKEEARQIVRRLVREYQAANATRCHEPSEHTRHAENKACARMNDAMAAANYLDEAHRLLEGLGFLED